MELKGRILVVDDERDICEMFKDYFELEGFAVEAALSGREAIEMAERTDFDVALIDIRMKGLDGIETARLLKAALPRLGLIMVTAHTDEKIIGKALSEDVLAVFSKPIDFTALIAAIEKFIAEKR